MASPPYEQRASAVQSRLEEWGCDGFFSVDSADNAYLTGFFGSTSTVLVARDGVRLLCDFRYIEQAARQTGDGIEIIECTGSMDARLSEQLESLALRRVAFEPDAITVCRRDAVAAGFSGELAAAAGICRHLREIKTPDEIERLAAASVLAEDALEAMLVHARADASEQELAGQLELEFRRRGAQKASFDTIVLFGARSSLPHGAPSGRGLRSGDIVLVDCGCVLDGYCSDLTRTFVFDRIPGDWFVDVYECVRVAQQAAVDAVCAGVAAKAVDAAARTRIAAAGYGARFGHGTGHGVGLEVHEAPRLNMQSATILEAGMVVTVEPGVYLPDQGGVRIEDLLVVTQQGCSVLTAISKELRIL